VQANVAYALEQANATPSGGDILMSRLPELLLVEVLRLHLASAPAADHGWLAAVNDPVLHSAMSWLHKAPEQHWTVSELARRVAVSRSLLDARFREVLRRSPIRYLTEWRMHLAEDLLATTELGVGLWPAASATTPKKHLAAHSSASMVNPPASGDPRTRSSDRL